MDQPRHTQTQIAKFVPRNISESLGKLPPSAVDLEETVLGAIMLEKNAIIEVAGFLRVEHFYTEQHREIYSAIQLLFGAGSPIDMKLVVKALRDAGRLEVVGGAYYIAELTSKVSSGANIEAHARVIVEYAMKRSLITLAGRMTQDGYDDTQDIFSLIDRCNLELQEVLDDAIGSKTEMTMVQLCTKAVEATQSIQAGKHSGLDSGYQVLDALLNGFQKTDLIIGAARPGVGKTSYFVQAAKQIAERGSHVGIFSLEMSGIQLVNRLICAECEVDPDKIKKGLMNEQEWGRYMDASGLLSRLPIHIDDTPMMTIFELRARAMKMKVKYNIELIVVDYIQLVKGSGKQGQNRDQELGEISRTLKGIAKELDIPVIALSQLSRAVETRGGSKRPQLSDLRESGSLEGDADIVIFFYRPEYYHITVDEDGYPTHGLCEVIVAKHRNGSTETVKQKFVGRFTKFSPWIMEQHDRQDQQYLATRVKNVLPSEKSIDDFNDNLPF